MLRLRIAVMRWMLGVGVARKKSTGSGDGKSFVIEQAFNFENGFDVFAAIEAMAAGTLHRLQRGKFRLPVAKDESLGRGEAADFADAEKCLVREGRSVVRFRCWSSAGHVYSYRRPILWSVNPRRLRAVENLGEARGSRRRNLGARRKAFRRGSSPALPDTSAHKRRPGGAATFCGGRGVRAGGSRVS
jgi:hypothetical protein